MVGKGLNLDEVSMCLCFNPTDFCDPFPCDVNAVCTVDTSGFTCTCNPPLVGSGLPGDCGESGH